MWISQGWWVVAFCATTSFTYLHFMNVKKQELQQLSLRIEEIDCSKQKALCQSSYLRDRISSQTDPAWIEMVLIRDLGVVPAGYLKVHFK